MDHSSDAFDTRMNDLLLIPLTTRQTFSIQYVNLYKGLLEHRGHLQIEEVESILLNIHALMRNNHGNRILIMHSDIIPFIVN